ncbi:unnamed protein product [Notodromas monacha]|uniref:Uncharacterized protein n=1 Tax=Notodromas monacha TaxID=399045 RepID=A0A7R9BV79_9CRUS|nr:unnamed protein product [Notodromas monacha]CAG0921013.1 unnamed protein product [Notodromas monacha]
MLPESDVKFFSRRKVQSICFATVVLVLCATCFLLIAKFFQNAMKMRRYDLYDAQVLEVRHAIEGLERSELEVEEAAEKLKALIGLKP